MASRFWVGGTGTWDASDTTHWAASSGGASGASVPSLADTVTVDANSGIGTITLSTSPTIVSLNYNKAGLTLSLGSNTLTVNGTGNPWTWNNGTLSAGTSTIIMTGTGGSFSGGNQTYATVQWTGSGSPAISSVNTFDTIIRTGTVAKTDGLTFSNDQTVNTALNLNGNSAINRLNVASNVAGSTKTITLGVSATFKSGTSNADFSDIAVTGGAAGELDLSSIPGLSGDGGGNSGVTFTTSTSTSLSGASPTWSTGTWSVRVPLPQDNVTTTATGTITMDMPRVGANLDFTGFSGTYSANVQHQLFGSLTLSSSMTIAVMNCTFSGRSSHTITSNGTTLSVSAIKMTAPSGTYTLQDNLLITGNSTFNVNDGTFTTNDHTVTVPGFALNNGTVNLGASIVNLTLTQAAVIWSRGGGTLNAGTSTIVVAAASGATRTFNASTVTYNNLDYSIAGSSGTLTINGAATFNSINVGAGRSIKLAASTTKTLTSLTGNGSPNAYVYLPGTTGSNITVPDSTALSITGDLDIRVKVALDTWSGMSSNNELVSKRGTTNSYEYSFRVTTVGKLELYWGNGTTAVTPGASTVITGFFAGSVNWVRATRTTNGPNYDVKYYTSTDGSSWTQLGTTVSITTTANAPVDTTNVVTIGEQSQSSSAASGKFYKVDIRNNILDNGTGVQLSADFASKAFGANSFTESSPNAATVTLASEAVQAGDGRIALLSTVSGIAATLSIASGTVNVDYWVIKDSTATGGASFYAGTHSIDSGNNAGWIFLHTATTSGFLQFFE